MSKPSKLRVLNFVATALRDWRTEFCPGIALRVVVSFLLLVVPLTSCSDRATRQDAAGGDSFELVANTESADWKVQSAWKLDEDLRLGAGPTGPENEQFGRVSDITTDSQGRVFILDGLAQHIKVFDASGNYLRTIGQKGSGPGEFTGAKAIAIGPADRLWVIDDGEMRYSIFGPSDQLIDTFRRDIRGFLSSASVAVLPDGSFIDWAPLQPDGRFGSRLFYVPLKLMPPDFYPDSLPPIRHAWKMINDAQFPVTRFAGEIAAAADNSGSIWFANTSEYLVYRRGLSGDTTLAFSLDATAPVMGDPEREHIREAFGRNPNLAADYVDALPARKPIIQRIVLDNAGHVLLAVDLENHEGGSIIDIFRDTGAYLGRVVLPTPMLLPSPISEPTIHATADHLYLVTVDDLDVPYVVRFQIDRTKAPAS